MSYRPQIKKSDGTMQDLPLDAETVKGKTIGQIATKDTITDAEVATNANIAQSKVKGLMTDYVASISVSGRTVTYKNKNGVNMGSITTQDTTYGLASQSSNGLMSSTDKTKLDGIQSGAQKNTVLGVKGGSESAYRTGNVNITKANIGLGNVDNTSDEDKPVSTATQTALNGKANTSGTYPNLTVGKATNADKATNATNATNAANATKATQDGDGNVIKSTYATKSELSSGLSGKANTSGSYPNLTVGKATNADNAANATKADAIKQTDTRSTNELPTFYYNKAKAGQNFTFEFKESAAIGLTGQSTYCQLQTYAKWTDSTGGNITQVAVVDTNYFIRTSTGSTGWGAWEKMALDSSLPTKLSQLTNDLGFYAKPTSGIPETDLAQGVKNKLNSSGLDGLYIHHICMTGTGGKFALISLTVICNVQSKFTLTSLKEWLSENGYSSSENAYPVSGGYSSGSAFTSIFAGLYSASNSYYTVQLATSGAVTASVRTLSYIYDKVTPMSSL